MGKHISFAHMWNYIPQEFYFIRHGQTDANVRKVFSGRKDIELNETGITQARELAMKMDSLGGLCGCWTSPLKRTINTAQVLTEKLEVDIFVDDDLIERDFGDLEGLSYSVFLDKERLPNSVETRQAMKKRILRGLTEIVFQIKEQKLQGIPLIVGHGGVFNALSESLSMELLKGPVPNSTPIHIYRNSNANWNYQIMDMV